MLFGVDPRWRSDRSLERQQDRGGRAGVHPPASLGRWIAQARTRHRALQGFGRGVHACLAPQAHLVRTVRRKPGTQSRAREIRIPVREKLPDDSRRHQLRAGREPVCAGESGRGARPALADRCEQTGMGLVAQAAGPSGNLQGMAHGPGRSVSPRYWLPVALSAICTAFPHRML